jgi:hypothetical protein
LLINRGLLGHWSSTYGQTEKNFSPESSKR